jgi:hypothetical protein
VSLSTRVPPDLRERLLAAADDRGVPLSALARDLIAAGLDGGSPERAGDGDVVREVGCRFAHFGPEAGLRREICMALARTAEAGGTAGIAAGRELLVAIAIAENLFEDEEDCEEDNGQAEGDRVLSR